MKNIFTLFFTIGLLLLGAQANAQGVYVVGSVTDGNGNSIANTYVLIQYDDCGSTVLDTVLTDPNGFYQSFGAVTCTQGAIYVEADCPNGGTTGFGQGSYNPGTQTVNIDITTCGTSTSCTSTFTQTIDAVGGVVLDGYATGGTGPYTYEWYVDSQLYGNTQTVSLANFQPGYYYVCLVATDANGVICDYCEDVVIQSQGSCNASFVQGDSAGVSILDGFVSGNDGPYSYQWSLDGNIVGNNQYLELANYPDGTYYACLIAYNNQGLICSEYCQYITIQNQTSACDVFIEFWDDSTGVYTLDAVITQGNNAPYTFEWSDGQVGNPIQVPATAPGTYTYCVTATDASGDVCDVCTTFTVGNNNPTCFAGFTESTNPNGVLSLDAWAQPINNPAVSYSYVWDVNGVTVTGSTVSGLPVGTSYVCVTAYGTDNSVCTFCDTVVVGGQNTCFADVTYVIQANGEPTLTTSVLQGSAPFTYLWSTGETTSDISLANLPSGTYSFCVTVTDATGMQCNECISVTLGNSGTCLDWSVIDLANAPCTYDYNPVCGCDGIEYTNACIAYYCFGVLDWTDGPCNYNGGGIGTGGNTGGTPVDSCATTAEFFYYGDISPNGGFDLFFFGFGNNADEFIWTMGDGNSATGSQVNYTYYPTDSIQAYTVCMTSIAWADSCTATICETFVLDSTPNGYIGGEVVDGNGIGSGGEGQVERIMNAEGDPIAGAIVELQDPTGAIIATTVTTAAGKYEFTGLQFGDYFVHVNIDGVNHTPDLVQIRPYIQQIGDINYEVVDNNVLSGIDGVSFASGIAVSPNPTQGNLSIALELHDNADINVIVTDILGKTVSTQTRSLVQGTQRIDLDLANLPTGLYMVSLQANGEIYTTKIVKE